MRISKKILAIALSILMAVSMMPFTVFAATANLSDILNAWTGDKYVEITDTDVVVDVDTTLTGHILDVYGNTTIDLNGHNLVAGAANSSGQEVAIWINPGANVTITDSAQPSYPATYSTSTGDLTIKNGVAAISSTYYGVINEGNLTLGKVVVKGDDNAICVTEGGTLTTSEANSIVCGGTYGVTYPGGTATLNLTKGMIYGQYGVSGNSSWDSQNNAYKFGGNTINIGAAKIYGKGIDDGDGINGAAIVLGADDDCNITGSATIYGYDAPAIVVRASADLDITGSPSVQTYGTVTEGKVLDGSTTVPSAPVVVDTACGYTRDASNPIDVDIAGGTYETKIEGVADSVALVGESGETTADFVEVTGGTYKTKAGADDVSDLIVDDPTTPDVHKVLDGSGKVVTALVEMDGNYYANATMAMKDVPTDGTQKTITLLDDISISGLGGVKVLSGQNVVFDLNGKTWTMRGTVGSTGSVTNGFQFLQGSTVKIKDGTITAKLATVYTVIQNYGDLTIENATIQYTSSGANKTAVSSNSGNVVIKNSTITGPASTSSFQNQALSVTPGWGGYTATSVVVENTTINGDVNVDAQAADSTAELEFKGTTNMTRGDIKLSDTANGTLDVKNTGTGIVAPEGYEWVGDGATQTLAVDNHTVAKIGDAKYDTLNAAITAASTGDTIVLVKDTTLSTTDVAINKNLTIDFGEYTVTAARWPFINHATLTLNGTTGGIASARGVVDNYGTLIINGGVYGSTTVGTPTFWNNPDGVIVMNGGTINAVNAGIYNENATFTMNDGVINSVSSSLTQGNKYSYAVRNLPGSTTTMNGGTINAVHGGIAAFGDGGSDITTVVINGGTITTNNSDAGNDAFYAIYVSGNGTSVTVNDGTFSSPRAAVMLDDDDIGLTENAALVITGGTFNSPSGVATVTRGQNDSNPSISGGTFSSEVPYEFCADGYIPVANAGGTYGVEGGNYVAAIGSTGYETLAAAFAAASDGDTIKIVADATGNGIAVPANTFGTTGLTVDFNGHKYTCNGNYAGSTGTQRQVFQLNQGNKITFKDGTITSAGARMLIQNYSDLTLDNMTLDQTGHTDFADKTPYALSNNNGTVVINDTTINACNDGFAFDACRYASYTAVSVTVTGDSEINGDIEMSASANDAKDGLAINLLGGELNGNIVLDASAQTAMANSANASVTKADDFTQAAPAGYKWESNGDGTSSLVEDVAPVVDAQNGSFLTLDDNIKANVVIDADEYASAYGVSKNDIYVTLTYNHNHKGTEVATSTDIECAGTAATIADQKSPYYGETYFTYDCAPAQLKEPCIVKVYTSAADAEAGENAVDTMNFNAKGYCDTVINIAKTQDAYATAADLCESIIDYAKAAQLAFGYNDNNDYTITEGYYNNAVTSLTASQIEGANDVDTAGAFYGFAFDCVDELNVLLIYNSAQSGSVSITNPSPRSTATPTAAADTIQGYNALRISGIGSGNLDKTVNVTTADGTVSYTVGAIAKIYVNNSATYGENMTNLARAIYLYGQASAAYFG